MYLTWTVVEHAKPVPACAWRPERAVYSQAGQAGAGAVELTGFTGSWWSVLSTWNSADDAVAAAPVPAAAIRAAWHVVLEPVTYRGDAVLGGGAVPLHALPTRGKVTGAAAVITLAGLGDDPERSGEFIERVAALGQDVRSAPGHLASVLQVPDDGPMMTMSAWRTLRDAVTWSYHRPEHAATVRRHEEHALVAITGFLRCAVVQSSGTLSGIDPLAGLTGRPVLAD